MTVDEIKRRSALAGTKCRAIWQGDDGTIRIGHSGDVCQMMDDLGAEHTGPSPKVIGR